MPLTPLQQLESDLLHRVSRTFALTIPVLPATLSPVVGNAYLLCRIADTIEDTPGLPASTRSALGRALLQALNEPTTMEPNCRELASHLVPHCSPGEQQLLQNAARIVGHTARLPAAQRRAINRALRIMVQGMSEFQQAGNSNGLADLATLNRYCYCVAGVVGEMLTELFIDASPAISLRQGELRPLAIRFGQGLQMTNILKDLVSDRQRGACWLPQRMTIPWPPLRAPTAEADLDALLRLARSHLLAGMRYCLALPRRETAIRRFCIWPLAMALLTLRRIGPTAMAQTGQLPHDSKISRRAVRASAWLTWLVAPSNLLCGAGLRALAELEPARDRTAGLPGVPQ